VYHVLCLPPHSYPLASFNPNAAGSLRRQTEVREDERRAGGMGMARLQMDRIGSALNLNLIRRQSEGTTPNLVREAGGGSRNGMNEMAKSQKTSSVANMPWVSA
jgi:hypothetical protein